MNRECGITTIDEVRIVLSISRSPHNNSTITYRAKYLQSGVQQSLANSSYHLKLNARRYQDVITETPTFVSSMICPRETTWTLLPIQNDSLDIQVPQHTESGPQYTKRIASDCQK